MENLPTLDMIMPGGRHSLGQVPMGGGGEDGGEVGGKP